MLPAIRMYFDGILWSALLDSGYSRTIVREALCCTWRQRSVVVTMLNGETRACCEIGTIEIHTEMGNLAKVDVLVVKEKLLDMLLGYDAIKSIGGVLITRWKCMFSGGSSGVHQPENRPSQLQN